jgi:alpha-methylacyl-CoA racemase
MTPPMGPLHGIRVVELAAIGPGPFCAMLLGDLGAEVIRVDRVGGSAGNLPGGLADLAGRNRSSIAVDLKQPDGVEIVLGLVERSDVLVEGFRPGVAERLGIGPADCHARNPGLVYGRMTGWGQEGPLAATAGHDIDYIAVSGALASIGRSGERPVPPLNLVGDYGGGALYLAVGILAALVERTTSGAGDVVDAAMVDGAASLMTPFYQMRAIGAWRDDRGTNLLDGGAPFYDTYETSDGNAVAVGALEPQFYQELIEGLGLEPSGLPPQYDPAGWPELRDLLAARFASRTRDEWVATFDGTDACVAPVLTMGEAPRHPHAAARGAFVDVGGVSQPAPAPRFSRSATAAPRPPVPPGGDTDAVLAELGRSHSEIAALRASRVVG